MSRPSIRSAWVFRCALVALNVLGLLWIHQSATRASHTGVRVLAALPTHDVDSTDRLTLVFDQDLPLSGTPGEVSLAAMPITVTPEVAGQWFWPTADRLEYRLESPLPPGRRFTLRAGPALEQLIGRKLIGAAEFHFATQPLQLLECKVTSADGEHANLELEFNQDVNPADLLRHLDAADARTSEPRSTDVLTQTPGRTLAVRVSRPGSDQLVVSLRETLAGAGADLPLGESVRRILTVDPAFAVVDSWVQTPSLGETSLVSVRCSRMPDTSSVTPPARVQVEPPVSDLRVRTDYESILLVGRFEPGRSYRVRLSADIQSADGDRLGRDTALSVKIPDREPCVRFTSGSGILSQNGNLLLELRHVNTKAVRLQASRVHANNLASHLRGEQQRATSRGLPEKTIAIESAHNLPGVVAVDLRQLIGAPQGIYRVQARGPEGTWMQDAATVAVTDLAITAKQERESLCVWVTSLSAGRPMPGTQVAALSYNGQVLATADTGEDGIARLATPPGHPDGEPWAIVARHGEDTSFILPGDRPWMLDHVDRSGRATPTSYDVMLYSDRGVYRPGDTILLTGIVRDAFGAVPPVFPLTIGVLRPDGKEVAQLPVSAMLGGQGVFHADYPTDEIARTGPYRFRVTLPGSKEVLGNHEALVEEFVPIRLEVRAAAAKPRFDAGEDVRVDVSARYLFDQPGADLPVQLNGAYRRTGFTSSAFADFSFAPGDPKAEQPIETLSATLDDEGRASLAAPTPTAQEPGLWIADLAITVSEQGGRSVSASVDALVDTAGRHIGVRLPAGRIVPVGAPTTLEWVQVTGEDAPAPGPAALVLEQVIQETTLEQVDRRLVWKTNERQTRVSELELQASDQDIGRIEITCPEEGRYRLTLTDRQSGVTTRLELYAAQDLGGDLLALTGPPERVELHLDQDAYAPGSVARLAVNAPFAGTLLLTLETHRVVDTRVVTMESSKLTVDLPVPADIRGGAFLAATVVRAIDPSAPKWLPHRAAGMTRLRTRHTAHALAVSIEAAEQARPGAQASVHVRTHAPVDPNRPPLVHLWAVDEGLLLPTRFATPDPLAHFFAERKSEVTSADIFGELLPDHQRPVSMTRIGADGEWEEGYRRRLTPVAAPRRTPAVIWQAAVPTDAQGSVELPLALPDMTGRLRLMVAAVDHDLYGRAEHAVTLTSPLLVEMTCPRFAAPGDEFDIPLKLFNTTAERLSATLSLEVTGPIRLHDQASPTLTLEPNTSGLLWARAVATGLGPVSIVARAEAASSAGDPLTSSATAAFAVRPTGPLDADARVMTVAAGESLTLTPDDKWLPASAKTTISVGARPSVQLQPAVEALIGYPYGCAEQTTSRLIALLHAPELLRTDVDTAARAQAVVGMIDAGIARLWSMQTRSGGIGYWPGDSSPNLWASLYAAEFLVLAEQKGHNIDAAFLESLGKYLESRLESARESESDEFDLQAHLCYVLTRMKRSPQGWLARLAEQSAKLDMAGKAHLAAAWLHVGRRDRAIALLSEDMLSLNIATTSGSRLTSQVHQESVLLDVLLEIDREHAWIPVLAERLEKARRQGCWGSTLENASALAALIHYQLAGQEPASFEGTLEQGETSAAFTAELPCTLTLSADQPISLRSQGAGKLYVSVSTQGLLEERPSREYDRKLQVARRWLDRTGEPIELDEIRVGDLVRVEISIVCPEVGEYESLDNVAIVDALPAGLEVENPRLAGSEQEGDDESFPADHVEFRDDRVVVFSSVGNQPRVFRYALRAMTAGTFALPAVQASSMYDASFASCRGAGQVSIGR